MNNNDGFLDVFNSTTASASSSRSPAPTIRPRNRRLVSTIGDDGSEDAGGMGSSGSQHNMPPSTSSGLPGESGNLTPPHSRAPTPSLLSSRGASPIPSKHPSRHTDAPTSHPTRGQSDIFSRGFSVGGGGRSGTPQGGTNPAGLAADLWESSWTSLQGLASSVLGSNATQGKPRSSTRGHQRRKPSTATNIFGGPIKSSPQPSSWGPSSATVASRQIGAGTKEDRHAFVQAKKREALLQANGEGTADTMGRFKRRDSGARPPSPSAKASGQDEDALVYVHHVVPNDSIMGVTIKYGCQQAIMRKANGFWPSDSIQTRKTVLIPVEACTAKGRRVPTPPPEQDLLGDDAVDSLEDLHSSSIAPPPGESSGAAKDAESFGQGIQNHNEQLEASSSKATTEHHDDPPWKHESWVQIEGFTALVEIGRVPRRNLGFFPRTRRKSQSLQPYSDFETPPTSSDISRVPSQNYSRSQTPPRLSTPQSGIPESWALPRTRSSSAANLSSVGPSFSSHRKRSSFYLSGPGGVGTLSQDSIAPGPAPDRLTKFFRPANPPAHLAPPRRNSIDSTTSTVVSNASSTTGMENFGGAIEGWVRKVASRAKTGLNEMQQQHQLQSGGESSGSGGFGSFRIPGIGAMGDLIELDDGMEGSNNDNNNKNNSSPSAGIRSGSVRDGRANSRLQPQDDASLRGRRYGSPSPGGSRRGRSTLISEERFKDD